MHHKSILYIADVAEKYIYNNIFGIFKNIYIIIFLEYINETVCLDTHVVVRALDGRAPCYGVVIWPNVLAICACQAWRAEGWRGGPTLQLVCDCVSGCRKANKNLNKLRKYMCILWWLVHKNAWFLFRFGGALRATQLSSPLAWTKIVIYILKVFTPMSTARKQGMQRNGGSEGSWGATAKSG